MNKPASTDVGQAPEELQGSVSNTPSLRRPLPRVACRNRGAPPEPSVACWETLTEEDWEFFRTYDGPEVLGPPPPPPMKRRPRRRGETVRERPRQHPAGLFRVHAGSPRGWFARAAAAGASCRRPDRDPNHARPPNHHDGYEHLRLSHRARLAGRDAGSRRRAVRPADAARRGELSHQRHPLSPPLHPRAWAPSRRPPRRPTCEMGLLDAEIGDAIAPRGRRGDRRRRWTASSCSTSSRPGAAPRPT